MGWCRDGNSYVVRGKPPRDNPYSQLQTGAVTVYFAPQPRAGSVLVHLPHCILSYVRHVCLAPLHLVRAVSNPPKVLLNATADDPAMSKLLGKPFHSANTACGMCPQRVGTVSETDDTRSWHDMTVVPPHDYQGILEALRVVQRAKSKTAFERLTQSLAHGYRFTPFLRLPYFSLQSCAQDLLHVLHEGVLKFVLKHFVSVIVSEWEERDVLSFLKNVRDFIALTKRTLPMSLRNLCPSDILEKIDSCKASEMMCFVNFLSVHVFAFIHSKEPARFTHADLYTWEMLVDCSVFWGGYSVKRSDLPRHDALYRALIDRMHTRFPQLSFPTNTHFASHLCGNMDLHGPNCATWCYAYERALMAIKKMNFSASREGVFLLRAYCSYMIYYLYMITAVISVSLHSLSSTCESSLTLVGMLTTIAPKLRFQAFGVAILQHCTRQPEASEEFRSAAGEFLSRSSRAGSQGEKERAARRMNAEQLRKIAEQRAKEFYEEPADLDASLARVAATFSGAPYEPDIHRVEDAALSLPLRGAIQTFEEENRVSSISIQCFRECTYAGLSLKASPLGWRLCSPEFYEQERLRFTPPADAVPYLGSVPHGVFCRAIFPSTSSTGYSDYYGEIISFVLLSGVQEDKHTGTLDLYSEECAYVHWLMHPTDAQMRALKASSETNLPRTFKFKNVSWRSATLEYVRDVPYPQSKSGGRIIPVRLIKSVVGLCPAPIRGANGLLRVIHLPFPE